MTWWCSDAYGARTRCKDASHKNIRPPPRTEEVESTKPKAREIRERCESGDLCQAPRRSASQVPEHSPPLHEPAPAVPESRPEPVALLLPALTVTVTWPLLATLPLMVAGLEPSASRAPLRMRIGYR